MHLGAASSTSGQPRLGVTMTRIFKPPPDGALTWNNSTDRRREALARWRNAVCATAARFEIRLAWVICDNVNWTGSTSIGDTKIMQSLGCNRQKVQAGLKRLSDMGAIIRITMMAPNLNRKRRIHLASKIVSEKINGCLPLGRTTSPPKSKDTPLSPPGDDNPI